MKIKNKHIIIVFLFLILHACCVDCETNPMGGASQLIVINKSAFAIELEKYRYGEVRDTFNLFPHDTIFDSAYEEDGTGPSLIYRHYTNFDSLLVIYSDTISVMHGGKNYEVERNLQHVESFIETTKDGVLTYTYIFTDEDYQEALEINGFIK